MNYLTKDRQDALAAEYVLGTLQGPARARFQRLLIQHSALRQSVWQWEKYLNQLGGALPEQTPDPHVWESIQVRLGFERQQPQRPDNVIELPPKRVARRWQWLAGISSAAALLLAALLIGRPFEPPQDLPAQVAVVQSEKAQPLWLIELRADRIDVRATDNLLAEADKDYELWMVAADGRAPVSLGLLPETGKLTLPRPDLFDQVEIAALAVSLEPPGGSPTGQPTTVLYTAELAAL